MPPSPQALKLVLPTHWPAHAVLEIREDGQDVVLRLDADVRRSAQVPPRYGITWFRVGNATNLHVERVRAGKGLGEIELRLHCDVAQAERLWRWTEWVNAVAVQFDGGVGSLAERFPDESLAASNAQAFDPFSRAMAQHLLAQALLLAGRSAEAADAFAKAATAWSAAGEPARASSALVGIAEDLNRSGQYPRVLDLARSGEGRPDGSHYFGARLENARCLALHYVRRLDEAAQCYAWVSERFDALDETLELASVGIDYAALESSRSHLASARTLLHGSAELAQGPQSRTVRARALFALAMLDRDQGDFARALDRLRQAQQLFDDAGERRWEANVLLQLGSLLNQFHAHGEAHAAARLALTALSESNAPARVAAANSLLARIALSEGTPAAGIDPATRALTAYRQLDMSEELAQATLLLARLQAEAGFDAQSGATLQSLPEELPVEELRVERRQLEARLALNARSPESARSLLARPMSAMTWRQRIEHGRLQAEVDWQAGHIAQAHVALLAQASAIADIAERIDNVLLAHLARTGIDALRETAIDLIARELVATEANHAAAIAHLVPWVHSVFDERGGQGARTDAGNDVALEAALLVDVSSSRANDAATRAATRALVDRLSRPDRTASLASPVRTNASLHVLQSMAQPGRPLLVLLRGRRAALRLQFVARRSPQVAVVDLPTLRDHLAALRDHIGRPEGDLAAIDRHARTLSTLLFDGFNGAAPAQLQVLANGLSSSVPWPALYWPGGTDSLVATTSVSLVLPQTSAPPTPTSTPSARIDVLLAAQDSTAVLPNLSGATLEPTLIEHALPARTVRSAALSDRAQLLGKLAEPGTWLHISAHGLTSAERLLGSGIWLDPQEGGNAEFLSWADVLERGVGTDLLVLNACQLAPGDAAAASAALDFATAMSRAGAHHIVAAQWPVSDTASAVWVPAFYRALAADGGQPDVAFALAEARRALRASRAFRHPFHWAGWVHLERVAVIER
ncbi:MAG: CHAT domain-containing protein [Xanthomonadaceae bacterium]|nr:CHAT domain-containing protein [Xanthomonadaceae bacterium]